MSALSQKSCKPCAKGTPPMPVASAQSQLQLLDNWVLNKEVSEISKSFRFKNYYQTIAFVNAMAWIANQEDHHPDIEVSYNCCNIRYSTHSVGGLSENDFICAAKIDALS